jgi:hypothetical protein
MEMKSRTKQQQAKAIHMTLVEMKKKKKKKKKKDTVAAILLVGTVMYFLSQHRKIKRTSKIALASISGFIPRTNNFHDDLLIKPKRRIDQNTIRTCIGLLF